MTETLKTPNINFKNVTQNPGSYKLVKWPLNNVTANTITLDAVSSQLLEWKLPASQIYNLSKSFISYNISIPAPAAKANYVFNDTLEIAQNISFGTAGGNNLVYLEYANNYINVARKIDTKLDDFLASDVTSGLCKADSIAKKIFPPGYTPGAGNIFDLPATATYTGSSLLEPQYSRPAAAVASALTVQRTFPLSGVTGTLFSMPQDMFFGPLEMYLRINTAPSSKVGFIATSVTNPVTGAAVLESQPVLTQVYLYLAVQQDELVKASFLDKYNRGQLKFTIPYTHGVRSSTVGAGSFSIPYQISPNYGKLLKRILYAPFPSQETLNLAYDHSNWSGTKVSQIQTFLESQSLHDAIMSCSQPTTANPSGVMDDWREHKEICKGSVIQNPASYQLNWFFMDRFAQPSIDPAIPDSQVLDGLVVDTYKNWYASINTSANNFNHHVFAQYLREIEITPSGPQFL